MGHRPATTKSGFLETLRTIDGRPALLGAHIERLQLAGAEFDERALRQELERQLAGADQDVMIRIEAADGSLKVTSRVLPEHALEDPELPVSVILCEVSGYAYPHKSTERALHTELLAQATEVGAFEAVIHDEGQVIEGTRTNVFALLGDRLITPPLGRCLPGVTRSVIAQVAGETGLHFQAAALSVDELLAADEILLTNALIGVRRVTRAGGAPVAGRAPAVRGELHAALLAYYEVSS